MNQLLIPNGLRNTDIYKRQSGSMNRSVLSLRCSSVLPDGVVIVGLLSLVSILGSNLDLAKPHWRESIDLTKIVRLAMIGPKNSLPKAAIDRFDSPTISSECLGGELRIAPPSARSCNAVAVMSMAAAPQLASMPCEMQIYMKFLCFAIVFKSFSSLSFTLMRPSPITI